MGILREGGNMALRILRTMGVDPNKMYSSIVKKLHDPLTQPPAVQPPPTVRAIRRTRRWPSSPATCRGGAVRQAGPVIGRDKEIQRVIQILSRRTKNNPCLIGEPGVGKTAIAEGWPSASPPATCPRLLDKAPVPGPQRHGGGHQVPGRV